VHPLSRAAQERNNPAHPRLKQVRKTPFGPSLKSSVGSLVRPKEILTIFVPKGSAFLGSAGTRRFLEIQGNLGVDDAFTFAPNDIAWFSVFSFEASGYVPDDEKIDPDALLEILKKSNAASNEERKRRGVETLVLEDWFIAPHYDVQTKRLEWGTKLRQGSGGITVNYSIHHRERHDRFSPC
jgi:uncharacterized membrane-anchored protein